MSPFRVSKQWTPMIRSFCARVRISAIAVAIVAGGAQLAHAAEDSAAAEGGKSWAIPWLIIVLALALGIFITLRPANRSTEIKRDARAEL